VKICVVLSGVHKDLRRGWELETAEALRMVGNEVCCTVDGSDISLKPDLVFGVEPVTARVARLLSRRFGVSYAIWVIAGFSETWKGTELEDALKEADLLIANSKVCQGDWLRTAPFERELEVCHHGVDSRIRRYRTKVKGGYVVSVGTVEERKRTLWTVECCGITQTPLYVIYPVSNPAYEARVRVMAMQFGNTVFKRGIPDREKLKLLAGSKALIHSADWETFGLPILEAFYLNTPVVAYRLPVFEEIWGDCIAYFGSEAELIERLWDLQDGSLDLEAKVEEARRVIRRKGLTLKGCGRRLTKLFEEAVQ